uniref:Uncharacterized protein n=1 Tax=Oryza meridionalis TaxID=40149 RepID=A0A0E0C0Y1_9ORYZ
MRSHQSMGMHCALCIPVQHLAYVRAVVGRTAHKAPSELVPMGLPPTAPHLGAELELTAAIAVVGVCYCCHWRLKVKFLGRRLHATGHALVGHEEVGRVGLRLREAPPEVGEKRAAADGAASSEVEGCEGPPWRRGAAAASASEVAALGGENGMARENKSDVCEMEGAIRILSRTSEVFLVAPRLASGSGSSGVNATGMDANATSWKITT